MTVSNTSLPPVRNMPAAITPLQATKSEAGQSGKVPPAVKRPFKKSWLKSGTIPFWSGVGLSCLWGFGALGIIAQAGPARNFAGVPLVDWAIGVSSIVSPVALIWMVVAYAQRATDVQSITEPLRRQLAMITGESGAAEARIRRFNQSIREQIDLLKSVQNMSAKDFGAMLERVQKQRDALEQFEHSSVEQVREIQDVVRRNMQQIETLMDDKFTMLRILDDRLVQSGDKMARQTDAVRGQITGLLDEVDERAQQVESALERTLRDSKKLADTTHAQEATLTAAATAVADTLNGLSGKIDLNVTRFLERAGTAREEAERLAGALDTQARSLDEFSNTLPVRVSEAEAVMRGVADRLYASEQLAREQAVQLTEKLSWQVDGLQGFLDRFSARLTSVDGDLQQRRNDFETLVTRLDSAAGHFTSAWEVSMNGFRDRADDTLVRFSALNEETRKGADQIANHLSETTSRYENVAIRLHRLTEESSARLKEMTAEIATHLEQFESLRAASDKAGADVQERAAAAMQNLHHVLERLLSAREATHTIGETLVRDLHSAVDQNEHLITRLNEAAQMSVRAISLASESLGKQETESAERTRAASAMLQEAAMQMQSQAQVAERGLRDQAIGLAALLSETRNQIHATEQNLQGFAARAMPPIQDVVRQIDASAEIGRQSIGKFGEGLDEQLARLQQFHTHVGGMGDGMIRATSEAITSIEHMGARFTAARMTQEEVARQTLEQFAAMSDRLYREIEGLDGQSVKTVETLQRAAAGVGEQAYNLLQVSENSGAKIHSISTGLQNEIAQIRANLRQQSEELGADLGRAQQKFVALGEELQQRTDAAYGLLDRVAMHYNETTQAAASNMEARTDRLQLITSIAQSKSESLSAALTQQLSVVGNGANQLEMQAAQIGAASGKAMQQLSALSEKMTFTNEVANNNARQTIVRIDECNAAFMRQNSNLTEAAQTSTTQIQKVASLLGEQSTKLQDNGERIDQTMRQLATTAASVHEQSTRIRSDMEQQSQKLVAQLMETIAQLTVTSSKLEQTSSMAMQNSERAGTMLSDVAQMGAERLATSYQHIEEIAGKTESSLSSLGATITQQAASLSVVSEQLGEQYRAMTIANDGQRAQLVDLFDKLGGAHAQASDVAERTIVRLSESLVHIQQHLGQLSDQSQMAVGKVNTAGQDFAGQTNLLVQNAKEAEEQIRSSLSVMSNLQEQAKQMYAQIQDDNRNTGNVLVSLVDKLAEGNAELRDFSQSADGTINKIGGTIADQTRELGNTIAHFSDRQRTLTSALDAQRDMLQGMLQRLEMAQDETAMTTERTVARLSEETMQIKRHMESMEQQAQSTLAEVRTAKAGFADEVASLGRHAEQAEQQMRQALASTATLQAEARQVSESMHKESTRMAEQMNAAITQLSMTTDLLKIQSSSAVQVMDQAVLQFASTARGSSDQLLQQVGALHEAAGTAEDRLNAVGENVRSHLQLVSSIGDQTEVKAKQLADSAEYATNRLAALRDSFASADSEGQQLVAMATSRIIEARTALMTELKTLAEMSRETVTNISGATKNLAGQSDSLRSNLAMSESALQEVAKFVREENTQLPAILERSSRQIEAAVRALKDQTTQSDQALVGTADRFINVTSVARETLMEEMRRISATADQANSFLGEFAKALATQMDSLKSSMTSLSSDQVELVARASESVTQLAAASDRLAHLRHDAATSAERLANQFDMLDRRSLATSERLTETSSTVIKTVDALSQSTMRAEAQMVSTSGQLREQLERIRAGLQGQIDDINSGLVKITTQLEKTGTTLRSTTASTVADVEHIAQRFDQTSRAASAELTDKTMRMRTSTEEVAKLLSGFGDQLDTLLDRLASAGDGIRRHEGELITPLQNALVQLSSIATKLEEGRRLAATVSEESISKLGDVVGVIQKEMLNLTAGSQTAAGVMRGIGQIYSEQTQTLNKGVREAHGQVQMMGKSVDEMQQRTDRMRVSLKLQSEELMASLQQILSQLSHTGDMLGDAVDDTLKTRAEESLKKIS